jgi:2-phosphosulfolactate phosphatase
MKKEQIEILHLLEGAKSAEGLCVVIDVFRAFSLECWAYAAGAEKIVPVGTVEDAFALRDAHPEWLIAGERNGIKIEGFDFGNAPSEFENIDLRGRTLIHTTSAGVQGLTAIPEGQEILTGSLNNAKAIADYIEKKNPEHVSLVAMGWNALKQTEEDELCAEYIRSLLIHEPLADIEQQASDLRYTEGKKFFDPLQNHIFPRRDFDLCTMVDRFDFVIRVTENNGQLGAEKIDPKDF